MSASENNRDLGPDVTAAGDGANEPRDSLALAFTTIERPQVAQRLIVSARRRFPTMPIYVADQSLDVAAMSSFYTELNATLVRMPYDAGVCASRNRLAASINEEFFVLCDDDFVFGSRTDFGDALRILKHHPEIGVIGGKLYDYEGGVEYPRHWELFLNLDVVNRTLTSTPIFEYAPRARQMGSTRFYMCDAVMNFAVLRREMFTRPAIRWDERFKSNGEHEDFFLNMKLNSSVRVAYLPTMVAYHHHPEAFVAYRSRLRNRLEGWRLLFDKWNIDQHLEIGLGVRTIDDFDAVFPSDEARYRFFLNDYLSLRRAVKAPALMVGQGSSLSTVGTLDEAGEPDVTSPGTVRLLVRAADGRVITGSDIEPPVTGSPQIELNLYETPQARHSFVPFGAVIRPGRVVSNILFRYNPLARRESDFILWYRVDPTDQAQGSTYKNSSDACAMHLRWFADDGRVLMWEGSENLLYLGRTDYWAPLLVDVPVCPSDSAFMRFDLIAGESSARRPLATGFLFSRRSANFVATQSLPPPALDVLALTPWTFPEVETVLPPVSLDKIVCAAPAERLTPSLCSQAEGLILLPTSGLTKFDIVVLVGWTGLGAPLSIIHPPRRGVGGADASAPPQVALPRSAAQSVRIVGFIKGHGYREILLSRDYVADVTAAAPLHATSCI